MQHILKTVITLLISLLMQSGVVNLISTTPHDAVSDFMDGLKNRDSSVMEKYMDDSYVNFITNVQGDDAVVEEDERGAVQELLVQDRKDQDKR